MHAVCQRCNKEDFSWCITQAEIHIRLLAHWKIQLCRECTVEVKKAVHDSNT